MSDFAKLPGRDKLRVYWAFVWRSILITVGSGVAGMIVGGIAGFFVGLVGSLLGMTHDDILLFTQRIALVLGVLVGLASLLLYIEWLFASRLGGFRLRLQRDTGRATAPAAPRAPDTPADDSDSAAP
ncbi:MAG: hypothetical protein ACREVL_19280 [Solimonas sp.]